MSRVTPTDVKEIKPTDIDDTIVQVWIDAASSIVDIVAASCPDITDDVLAQIELYLTAHLLETVQPTAASNVQSQTVAASSLKFTYGNSGGMKGVESSAYGVTANMLSGGCLATVNQKPAFFCAVG